MNTSDIGIIGQGFVGTATYEGLREHFNVHTYDKFLEKKSSCTDMKDVCQRAKIVFVCLPTPMKKDGSCDLSILQQVIDDINGYKLENIVVIKSTIPPGTTAKFNESCKNIQIVFNPEFLTEANYIDDFKNQNRIIIGGPRPASTLVKNMFRKVFQEVPIIKTGSDTAESVKYFINTFLATKVSFSNEFKQILSKDDKVRNTFIKRLKHKARAMEIIKNMDNFPNSNFVNNNVSQIPLIGSIAAGKPIEAIENADEFISIPDTLISPNFKYFGLKVKGLSMIEKGIFDGDIAIIKKTNNIDNGKIAAVITNENEVTLKSIKFDKNKIYLIPANKSYNIKEYKIGEVQVQGTLSGIIRKYN